MFKKATREKAFLRLAIMGPAGSGKTYTSLLLAKHLGAKKIALIDSERGSARLYASLVDFDVCELESFAVERYMDAIAFAQREGYDCLIIDSLSHAWAGKDGILEFKDKRTEQSRSKDSFGAGWRDASPLHNKFIDAILAFRGHVIATLRTKTEYVIEEGPNGKKTPRKIGMAPVQRDGVEYEFTVVGDFIDHNKLAITKTRIDALNDAVLYKPGREMAETILAWLAEGTAPPPQTPTPQQMAARFVSQILTEAKRRDIEAVARAEIDKILVGSSALDLTDEEARAAVGSKESFGPLPKLRDAIIAGQLSARPPQAESAVANARGDLEQEIKAAAGAAP